MAQANWLMWNLSCCIKDFGNALTLRAHRMSNLRHIRPALRHQKVKGYKNIFPAIDHHTFIAETATVTGNINIAAGASVFYNSTWRNYHIDKGASLGANSTILERCSLLGRCQIGANVVIGVGSTLDCCEVHDGVVIGPGCAIALGAVLETGCILAPGTVIDADVRVPAGELWAGNPGEKVADVSPEQRADADHYIHEMAHLGHRHESEIAKHIKSGINLDYKWLMECSAAIEKRSTALAPYRNTLDVPLEAKQFMQPRHVARHPQTSVGGHMKETKIAPWLYRPALKGSMDNSIHSHVNDKTGSRS